MTATSTPARRVVAVVLLALVAVLVSVAGPATADATPVRAALGDDATAAVVGPQPALPRVASGGPLSEDEAPPQGHPGPVLAALLLAPPEVPAAAPAGPAVDRNATTGLDPGHGSPTGRRGPPAA